MSKLKRHQKAPIWREIDGLRQQTVGQLRVKHLEVFGLESRSNHKQYLVRRIAWRLQANAEGDLSERARERATVLAEEADLRIRAPQSFMKELSRTSGERGRDPRLPAPGSLLTRQFQGQSVSVEVLVKGFRYDGRTPEERLTITAIIGGERYRFPFTISVGAIEKLEPVAPVMPINRKKSARKESARKEQEL